MDVSENSGTPQIIQFNRVFHYKPSILGETPLFLDFHPYGNFFNTTVWDAPKRKDDRRLDASDSRLEPSQRRRSWWLGELCNEKISWYPLYIPSRELTYPTLGSSENHLQNAIFGGYVSSLEGISPLKFQGLWGSDYITAVDVKVWF